MNMGRIVLLTQREEKEEKIELEVRFLESHGYCVVDLILGGFL